MGAANDQSPAARTASAPVLSVVICTLNRAEFLKGALQSLACQAAPRGSFEVIVVDNGSTDGTPAAVGSLAAVLDVRYVREERTGLSHARNAGLRQARGAYVAYLDDDARARPHWVEAILAAVAREEPDVLGGPVLPLAMEEKPAWFPLESQAWAAGRERRELGAGEYVRGEGFAVKKSVAEALGGFRAELGMIGTTMGYGEETELQCRIRWLKPGARIVYCPDAVVEHLVRIEKMTLRWQLRRCTRQGLQAAAIYEREAFGASRFPRLHALGAMLGHLALAGLKAAWCPLRSRKTHRFWKAYVLLRVCPHVYAAFAYVSFLLGLSGGPCARKPGGEVGGE